MDAHIRVTNSNKDNDMHVREKFLTLDIIIVTRLAAGRNVPEMTHIRFRFCIHAFMFILNVGQLLELYAFLSICNVYLH